MKKTYPPRKADVYDPVRHHPRPVFGVDIDGTLGAYHEHFWQFAQAWLGRDLQDPAEWSGVEPFYSFLGISKATYRRIKLAYRRGGLKRSMPAFEGIGCVTGSLRKRGALVVLCTTRPYLSLENIDEDTRHWTARNDVTHDGILWGEHKYRDLLRVYGAERIVAVLEDEPTLVEQARSIGLHTLVHRRPYNEEVFGPRCDLEGAGLVMHHLLNVWEKEYL